MGKTRFNELNLKKEVLKSIDEMGYEYPSEIQEEAIPVILDGKDIIGQAQTGTGKTLAFAAPILSKLKKSKSVKAVILAPTRELAMQVSEETRTIAKNSNVKILAVYGGSSIQNQLRELRRGVDIVVGTPGRMIDLIKRRALKVDEIEYLVLDEADEMLNMGFINDIERIMRDMSGKKQTMLFSATMPREIKNLSKKYMKNDRVHIKTKDKAMTVSTVSQYYYEVKNHFKFESLCRIIDTEDMDSVLIFRKTKRGVDELVRSLIDKGFNATGMHGDMTQNVRISTLKNFKNKKVKFLVATDVAARGIDIDALSHVINYDLPQDVESYVHRIGRTGRAKQEGIAISLASNKDRNMLRVIERTTKSKITRKELPSVEDIFKSKNEELVSKVKKEIDKKGFEKYYPILEELKEESSIEDIAAALIKMVYKEELSFDYSSNTLEQPTSQTRLFINAGSMDKLTPIKLIEFLAETANIERKDIGSIDILTKFSFMDITQGLEKDIIKNANGKNLSGRKVRFEVASNKKRK
ncbi:MAG: DEAD/DEAH box helicase [Clostridium sp.]|nr:DEAD/DEAH box helicase [Clostridium sp.]